MRATSLTFAASVALALPFACARSQVPADTPPAVLGRETPAGATAHDAASLVRAMHDRWANRWYRTVAFRQRTSRVLPNDSVASEIWYEWASLPGKLRIQMGEPAERRGAIYSGDSTFVVRNDSVVRRVAGRNLLLVLGFDVYAQPPERTLQILRQEGVDLERFHADSWEGRPVWVVGAAPGDLRTKQFWVEQDRLLFVRLLEPSPADSSRISDVRFADYAPLGRAWIAPRVEVWTGGRRVFWEEYSDMRADPVLAPVLFDPDHWASGLATP